MLLTNESLGIQELTNKAYHESLSNISAQVVSVADKLHDGSMQPDVTVRQSMVCKGIQQDVSEFRARRLDVTIDGLGWISGATLFIVPGDFLDGAILGETEYLENISQDASQSSYCDLTLYYDGASSKSVHIPFKISDEMITECYIYLSVPSGSSAADVSVVIDHELGHGKDCLDRHCWLKDVNADIIDAEILKAQFYDLYDTPEYQKFVRTVCSLFVSGDAKRHAFATAGPDMVYAWFGDNMYNLNKSELIQHRKNFYAELKKASDRGVWRNSASMTE